MEIERKFLVTPSFARPAEQKKRIIEQAYLNTSPVVRVRQDNDEYYLTYKSKGFLAREEYNLPLTAEAYAHLLGKADGNIISKVRYNIALEDGYLAELDYFAAPFAPLVMVEVEFPDEAGAAAFVPPLWFGEEVTYDSMFHNSTMSSMSESDLLALHARLPK